MEGMEGMVDIQIHEAACRGCRMCLDICPTDVFAFDEGRGMATVQTAEDCIACLSCAYVCPSNAISHHQFHAVKNFYRDISFCRRMERFL